ncbi:MAG: tRNA (adenosine(37)-N6)-dimethylallyltransferase MiaA [Bacteroidales bacterium]|nr:tRNA (adenosine(37)-N6)-dimethylallyltransferase MiaA [Bacteroidales bacterium]
MSSPTFDGPTLYILTGPTAVGKTACTIELAQRWHAPILSADSRQFYREMRIGTAFPTEEELAAAQHFFVGMLSIHDYYNVYMYEQDVLKLLDELFRKHPVVIMTGGSPQYLDAVCHGVDAMPDPDPVTRQYVHNLFQNNGVEALYAQLRLLDPDYAGVVNPNDGKRMMRALEVSLQTGKPYSSQLHKKQVERNFRIVKKYLNRPREELFDRINRRVDKMMADGLLEEARGLYPYRELNALNTVGYKELFDYFDGKCTLEQAVTDIKTHTRRYAKRQLTWFKREYEEVMVLNAE